MNRNMLSVLAVLVAAGGILFAMLYFLGEKQSPEDKAQAIERATDNASTSESQAATPSSPIETELDQLSAQMIRELREEQRLNLSMGATLRAYREMFNQIHNYAQKVERDITMIEQINKDEFQQDVKLQASLFAGKKPELVAKHLEEFRAARVGAILAKMKEKEASSVLDVWAKQDGAKVSSFYREVMAAFLNNRRRDTQPALFNNLSENTDANIEPVPAS